MVALLVTSWVIGHTNFQASTITYAAPATRASVLIEDLARKTGRKLEVTPQTADEVLLVRVKDAPIETLLAHVAEAADAEWVKKSNAWQLTRTTEMQAAQIQRDTVTSGKQIHELLRAAEASLAKAPKWSEQRARDIVSLGTTARRQAIDGNRPTYQVREKPADTPADRTGIRLLRLIGPVALGRIRIGERAVFSVRPAPVQRGLPGEGLETFRDLLAMQQSAAAAEKAATEADPESGGREFASALGPGRPQLGVSNGFIAVERLSNWLKCNMAAFDSAGQLLVSGRYNLQFRSLVWEGKKSDAPEIPLTPASRAFLKSSPVITSGGTSMSFLAISVDVGNGRHQMLNLGGLPNIPSSPLPVPELQEVLTQPEKFDPLNLVVGDALGQVFEGNLVANLPDRTLFTLSRRWAQRGFTKAELLEYASSGLELNVMRQGGWTDIRSETPAFDRERRANRRVLGQSLRGWADRHALSLEEVTAWSMAQPIPQGIEDLSVLCLASLDSREANRIHPFLGRPYGIRLLATMTPAQREKAFGAGVSVTELSPAQRGWIEKELLGNARRNITRSARTPNSLARTVRQSKDFEDESTVQFPNGLPRTTKVAFSGQPTSGVIGFAGTTSQFLSPELLAGYIAASQDPSTRSFLNPPTFNRYLPAKQTTFEVNVMVEDLILESGANGESVDEEQSFQQTIPSLEVSRDATLVPYASLSDDFRRAVESAVGPVRDALQRINLKQSVNKAP